MSSKLSGQEIEKIIDTYFETDSIIETAKKCQVSTVKVRKILITAELWSSKTSDAIADLLEQGLSTAEIADELCMSVKNVQAYMPYERGAYRGDQRSLDAMRASKYRQRMKTAADRQVIKKDNVQITERVAEMTEKKNKDKLGVIKLHLDIPLDQDFSDVIKSLKQYGYMEKGISRDILVPSDITMHGLHYAILRAFGWQNGHLHNFHLPDEVQHQLTDGMFATWAALAGVYFRFPTENFRDIYWDDDYKESQSIKSWLKKKYTGPYKYKGYGEHYLYNQQEVEMMFARWPEITVHEFRWGADIQPAPYEVELRKATIYQVAHAFADVHCHELIERLPVAQVLRTAGTEPVDIEEIKAYLDAAMEGIDAEEANELYEHTYFPSEKKHREFLESYNVPVKPVTDELHYEYDYGDGWEVMITSDAAYHRDDTGAWVDVNGNAPDIDVELLSEVVDKHRPICIAKDCIELVDDVGGIHGFCEMLEILNGDTQGDPELEEAQDNMRGWASMMGWTGRRISPKQTL